MLTFASLWIFALLPLPWLVRLLLPPRRVRQVAVRVPFGDRLEKAGAGTMSSGAGKQDW